MDLKEHNEGNLSLPNKETESTHPAQRQSPNARVDEPQKYLKEALWDPFVRASSSLSPDKLMLVRYSLSIFLLTCAAVVIIQYVNPPHRRENKLLIPFMGTSQSTCPSSPLCMDTHLSPLQQERRVVVTDEDASSFHSRLEKLELDSLRMQQTLQRHEIMMMHLENRMNGLEDRFLPDAQNAGTSSGVMSKIDSELAAIEQEVESLNERLHKVENHVFVSEDVGHGPSCYDSDKGQGSASVYGTSTVD